MLRERGADLGAPGVRFRDLTMIFQPYDEPIYTDDCCHFGRRGNEIVARAIAQEILGP